MIRFHLDQHVSNAIARGLRVRGIDVTTTSEVGLQDAADERQLAYIVGTDRVIFTQDDDFMRIHSAGEAQPRDRLLEARNAKPGRDHSIPAADERLLGSGRYAWQD